MIKRNKHKREDARHNVNTLRYQLGVVRLEMNGLKDVVNLVLGDSDVSLGDLDACMVQYLIEKNQALSTSIVGLVDVSAEGLSEGVGREVANLNLVVVLEVL